MRPWLCLLAVLALPAHAAWVWSEPQTVNAVQGAAIFPHIESANRQGVAISGDTVGVVWEDNRSGSPQCYLATQSGPSAAFSAATRLSRGECFEPVVVALGGGRFVAAWEEAGRVHAQLVPGGAVIKLTQTESAQVTLAVSGDRLYAAWAEQAGAYKRVVFAHLVVKSKNLKVHRVKPVENQSPRDEQSWPALAVAGDGRVVLAWEDRRDRHSVPLVSVSQEGKPFSLPVRLTDMKSGPASGGLGAGTGAMRPTLTRWGKRGVAAVWLDKRDFLSGYDVYAALDDGVGRFGRNLKVQDSFGDNMSQWHATVVGHASGQLIALWDDARDGTSDVWLAEWNGEGFGDNVSIPAAAGAGAQSDPVASLDSAGRLPVVWLDRDDQAVTRIRYVRGERR